MTEYGKQEFREFTAGVRSMRRLSESIDQVFQMVEYFLKQAGETPEKASYATWHAALVKVTEDGYSSFDNGGEGLVYGRSCSADSPSALYRTGGGLKFGWVANTTLARNPLSEDGILRVDRKYEFIVFAKGGKFREGSRLRAALFGASWEIVEEAKDAVLPEDFAPQLGEENDEELAGVPAKYKASLIDD